MNRLQRYRISDVAKILGVTTRTLYNWENAKKIPQPKRDPMSNQRWYTPAEVRRLQKITGR